VFLVDASLVALVGIGFLVCLGIRRMGLETSSTSRLDRLIGVLLAFAAIWERKENCMIFPSEAGWDIGYYL
jgi:hypothetical protein